MFARPLCLAVSLARERDQDDGLSMARMAQLSALLVNQNW